MHRSNGPPRATKSELEMDDAPHFGLGKNAAGRYTFANSIGHGAGTTTLVGGQGTLMANAG